jgi:hypothetical protein
VQKKGLKFEWVVDFERSFQHLKHLLTRAPISRIDDPNEYFIVCTNACNEGLGAVISHNGYVVCYESKEHERHYATHDLELVAIVHALNMWRHYLMGKIFELRTNHSGVKYCFDQPTLNVRQSRWLDFINEYDFDIKHIKGKENKVDDELRRRVHEMHATTITMCQSELKHKIVKVAESDRKYMELKEKLKQGNLQQKIEDYKLEGVEIIRHRGKIYVPNSRELKNLILGEMHNVHHAR